MIRCTQSLFTQTSPSTFYRKNKLKSKHNLDQQYQITQSEISQKLQLILFSLREESSKVAQFYESQKRNLQFQITLKDSAIQALSNQNSTLKEQISVYVQKYGKIFPQQILSICQFQRKLKKNQQNANLIEAQNAHLIKIDNPISDKKRQSSRSTNYESKYVNSSSKFSQKDDQEYKSKQRSVNQHQNNQHKSLGNSTSSNFCKKNKVILKDVSKNYFQQQKYLYQLDKYKQNQVNIPRLICQQSVYRQQQVSRISNIECLKSNLPERESFINELDSNKFQYHEIQDSGCLGLESKGQNFFSYQKSQYNSQIKQGSNYKGSNCVQQSILLDNSRFLQQDTEKSNQKSQNQLQSLKTDSDIRLMRNVLQDKFKSQKQKNDPIQNNETKKQYKRIKTQENYENNKNLDLKDLKDLNFYYFKKLHEKYQHFQQTKYSDFKQPKQIYNSPSPGKQEYKKLKQLFSPLPQNLKSKKINLVINNVNNENVDKINKFYARQSRNMQNLADLFNQKNINTKKEKSQGKDNPSELINKSNKYVKSKKVNPKIL